MTLADARLGVRAPTLPRRWETAAAALCLAQFSEPLFAAIAQSQGFEDPPGHARWFFLPVYAFLGWVAWRDRRAALAAAATTPLLIALVGLAFVSAFWSIDPGATLRRSVWLALTTGFGLYLAWRYRWTQLLEVLGAGFILLIAGSFLTALLAPQVGAMLDEHPGAWSGLWTHKNTLGGLMALGVAICAAAAVAAPRRRMAWIGVGVAAFLLVLLSASKSALIASALGLGAIVGGVVIRRGAIAAVLTSAIGAGVVVVGAGVLLLAPDTIAAALGRDLTLTGRTDVWDAAVRAADARAWLGHGYGAFWLVDNGPAFWVRQAVNWEVSSAHSGWLELLLDLGRLGAVLFALQFALTLWRGVRALGQVQAGLWAPALIASFALYSLSESHVLMANDLFWLIYVAVAARLALDGRA